MSKKIAQKKVKTKAKVGSSPAKTTVVVGVGNASGFAAAFEKAKQQTSSQSPAPVVVEDIKVVGEDYTPEEYVESLEQTEQTALAVIPSEAATDGIEVSDELLVDDQIVVGSAPAADPIRAAVENSASLNDMYDRNKKLVYLFDVSGSMNGKMLPENAKSLFTWTDEKIEEFKTAIQKNIDELKNELQEDLDDSDSESDEANIEFEEADAVTDEILALEDALQLDKDGLVDEILEKHLDVKYNIVLEASSESDAAPLQTKMDAVKEAAKDFVGKRFEKYPTADITVYSFNTDVHLMHNRVSKEAVLDGVNQLHPNGGTRIYNAVQAAIGIFEQSNHGAGGSQIILISDGEDHTARDVPQFIAKMKQWGIVFDFIYVQEKPYSCNQSASKIENNEEIKALKRVCEETGGEFVDVANVGEFKRKFLAASSRLCLPPARV